MKKLIFLVLTLELFQANDSNVDLLRYKIDNLEYKFNINKDSVMIYDSHSKNIYRYVAVPKDNIESLNFIHQEKIPEKASHIMSNNHIEELSLETKEKLIKELAIFRQTIIEKLDYNKKIQSPKDITIFIDKIIPSIRPDWNSIMNYYGGLAKIASIKIDDKIPSKDFHLENGYFDLNTTIDRIKLSSNNKCNAIVKYSNNNLPLSFYGKSDSIEVIGGTYKVIPNTVDSLSIFDFYNYSKNIPKLIITIPDNKIFDKNIFEFTIDNDLYPEYGKIINEYIDGIEYIVNYIVSDDEFSYMRSIRILQDEIIKVNRAKYDKEIELFAQKHVEEVEEELNSEIYYLQQTDRVIPALFGLGLYAFLFFLIMNS